VLYPERLAGDSALWLGRDAGVAGSRARDRASHGHLTAALPSSRAIDEYMAVLDGRLQ